MDGLRFMPTIYDVIWDLTKYDNLRIWDTECGKVLANLTKEYRKKVDALAWALNLGETEKAETLNEELAVLTEDIAEALRTHHNTLRGR